MSAMVGGLPTSNLTADEPHHLNISNPQGLRTPGLALSSQTTHVSGSNGLNMPFIHSFNLHNQDDIEHNAYVIEAD